MRPRLTQKKQRPGGQLDLPAKVRSTGAGRAARAAPIPGWVPMGSAVDVPGLSMPAPAPGVEPAGREVFAESTPRRRSEETLRSLGLETALDTVNRLDAEGKHTEAAALRAWVNLDPAKVAALLRSLPGTRGGQSRELRLAMCGVAFLARRAGVVGYARRCCKDRLCPFCAARRSRMFAAALRDYLDSHPWPFRVFMTLTQKKRPNEAPRVALDRLLAAWRRFLERHGKAMILGGVRSMEVTARRKGTLVGDYEVEIPGVHAHLHCVVDVVVSREYMPGGVGPWPMLPVLRRRTKRNKRGDLGRRPRVTLLAAAWTASSPGAKEAGVDVQPVTPENTYQVAKYPVDFSGLVDLVDGAPGYVRSVLAALHGRRTVATFGTWKGIDIGLREKPGTLEYGDRALYTLATTGDALDVHWASGEVEPADRVLAALLEGPRAPL